jgi:hypothetical protein
LPSDNTHRPTHRLEAPTFAPARMQASRGASFFQRSSSAHRYSPRTSCSFTSNFAKIRSQFALSRHARHEPQVQRWYGASRGSRAGSASARNARYAMGLDRCIFTLHLEKWCGPVLRINAILKRPSAENPRPQFDTAPKLQCDTVPRVRREAQYRALGSSSRLLPLLLLRDSKLTNRSETR